MSLGYASRLSHREDLGGRLGDPELSEAPHDTLDRACKLAELIRKANKVIVFTGAGISTACGIPDFRGPQGVWTCQRKGLPPPRLQTSFLYAKPSLTHQALLGLLQSGKLDYICSQNVDSLHLRSGVPRSQIAEPHGNCFAERCKKCKKEYIRDFEMDSVGFKPTGRRCTQPNCRGQLLDHILDWEDALPDDEFKATQQHASSADLALCLGTSLQIIPAANLPLRTVKAGGKLAIINLQATPKDKKAELVIHSKVDEVLAVVMQQLGLPIPVYMRMDWVLLSHSYTAVGHSNRRNSNIQQQQVNSNPSQQAQAAQQQLGLPSVVDDSAVNAEDSAAADDSQAVEPASAAADSSDSWGFCFCICSRHGPNCPLPMVAAANVTFLGPAAAFLRPRELSGPLPWKLSRTCPGGLAEVQLQVTLQLVNEADEDKRVQQVQYAIARPTQPPTAKRITRRAASQVEADGSQECSFVTQTVDYSSRQQELIQHLQHAAEQSRLMASVQNCAEATAASSAGVQMSKKPDSSKRSSSTQAADGADLAATDILDLQAASNTGESSEAEVISSDYGASDSEESDTSEESDVEPTGIDGQNSSGRARKRAKRLNL